VENLALDPAAAVFGEKIVALACKGGLLRKTRHHSLELRLLVEHIFSLLGAWHSGQTPKISCPQVSAKSWFTN
jgi:hypothetical protein